MIVEKNKRFSPFVRNATEFGNKYIIPFGLYHAVDVIILYCY